MFVVISELRRKLGESKADQERRLQERLKRRQELIKEREGKGLNCDEAILDAIQEEEEEVTMKEERKKRKVCECVHKFRNQYCQFLTLKIKKIPGCLVQKYLQITSCNL